MVITKKSQVGKKKRKIKTPIPGGIKCCQGCGVTTQLEIHHVYGSSNRNNSSKYNCVEWLCSNCHRGKNGVHGENEALNMQLKQKHQLRLEKEMSREEFISLFGKNYL